MLERKQFLPFILHCKLQLQEIEQSLELINDRNAGV